MRRSDYPGIRTTVGSILREHGIEPAPERQRKTFLKAHWETLGAVDFTSIEVWTRGGLVTFYILVAMRVATRRIEIAGITPNPDAAWVQQMGRNLTDCYEGFFVDTRYVLVDRDAKVLPLRGVLEGSDAKPVVLPPKSSNLNPQIERFMRSLKDECSNRMVFSGEKSLSTALKASATHYHEERNHQGLGNSTIEPGSEVGQMEGDIHRRERLGGMLSYYHRAAA